MPRSYDNWEKLVAAVIRKEQLWQLFHENSRSPSLQSEASSSSSSSFQYLDSPVHNLPSFSGLLPNRVQPKLVFVSDSSPIFDFEDLVHASAWVLGNGTYRCTYKAYMDNGITVVVKQLKLVSMSEIEFKKHMELVQNIRHENMVELRAYFYSTNRKLMLYDHYNKGSVSALLHGITAKKRTNLDWETRKRIALCAARGIAHIHTQRGAKLVHGNIKASNIFLDSQQYGCVSDFGLTDMTSKTFLKTARYHAPEVKNSQNVSQASDVYNFGMLLLELLTRKTPNHDFDVFMWVNSVKHKGCTAAVFDVDLLKNPAIQDQMVKMLQIGIMCVARAPEKRPKMSAVLKTIEDISNINAKKYPSTTVNQNNILFDDLHCGFEFEDLLGSSVTLLGKGTFGTSYKVKSDNEIFVVVKRMKLPNLMTEEFRQCIDLIGRLRHENIVELKHYFCSKNEQFLVYDYYKHGSISGKLHLPNGYNGGLGRFNLTWVRRLKIALGAARGITHIHTINDEKLVHGNIRASNIFLNKHQYGLVSDVGLAKMTSQIPFSFIQSAGYCAPEVTDATKMSQASDVYSFGVVLLELVSGKSPTEVAIVRWIMSVSRVKWTTEVIDEELRSYVKDKDEMVKLLQIGLDCVGDDPESRPKMTDIVEMLEEIFRSETTAQQLYRLEDFFF